ncbi:hypothetical protein [Leptospira wolffii]|uniref:hypothetical protein n=1 Tax=Leptospira wolffii TaxID=409998 RepID=UPI000309CF75|nr:hypothetical protein [Leptospira wolffii]EPG66496.1 hypothetical protein LEP1GSC061_1421 [Leptospira wolffii serovar Khorat str. Khorat-H2]
MKNRSTKLARKKRTHSYDLIFSLLESSTFRESADTFSDMNVIEYSGAQSFPSGRAFRTKEPDCILSVSTV